jgi:hypothetical protein
MSIRTLLISALFLAISCVSVQANIDTRLNVPSNTASHNALLMAQSYEQDRLDELRDDRDDRLDDFQDDRDDRLDELQDRRDDLADDYYDDDDCDGDDDCEDDYDDDDCDDDDDDCD